MTATLDMTVRDIVANDFRAASVFQRYGIDFCCKGNRTVEDACRDGGVKTEDLLQEVANAMAGPPPADRGSTPGISGCWPPTLSPTITASYDRRFQRS